MVGLHTISRELNWDEFKIKFSITSVNPGISFSRLNGLKTVEVWISEVTDIVNVMVIAVNYSVMNARAAQMVYSVWIPYCYCQISLGINHLTR